MSVRAMICGCSGLELTADEEAFIREAQPWGLILFKRNILTPQQVASLTARFREILGRAAAPVLVDQEGGRVQRLAPPHWRKYPAGAAFEQMAGATDSQRERLAYLGARLIAEDLRALGVTVDCLPVLDVPVEGGHNVIGDRAYSRDPDTVASLGGAAARGLMAGGVLPVMKHIPGHGRAGADSHLELPVVAASRAELEASDFAPFRACAGLPAAMTAHVVYTALDPDRPATTSPVVIRDIVRGLIGFDGLLMSDDLSMKALTGTFREKAEALTAAGVDMALHCNGDLSEAGGVAEGTPMLAGDALRRAEAALAAIAGSQEDFDPVDAWAQLETGLAMIA
jgi:beta-N-acetylhexosaminidase